MSIQANLKEVLSELPAGVRLVAVSKFHPNVMYTGLSKVSLSSFIVVTPNLP